MATAPISQASAPAGSISFGLAQAVRSGSSESFPSTGCSLPSHLRMAMFLPLSESGDQTGQVGEDFFQHVAVHHFNLGHLSDAVALG